MPCGAHLHLPNFIVKALKAPEPVCLHALMCFTPKVTSSYPSSRTSYASSPPGAPVPPPRFAGSACGFHVMPYTCGGVPSSLNARPLKRQTPRRQSYTYSVWSTSMATAASSRASGENCREQMPCDSFGKLSRRTSASSARSPPSFVESHTHT